MTMTEIARWAELWRTIQGPAESIRSRCQNLCSTLHEVLDDLESLRSDLRDIFENADAAPEDLWAATDTELDFDTLQGLYESFDCICLDYKSISDLLIALDI